MLFLDIRTTLCVTAFNGRVDFMSTTSSTDNDVTSTTSSARSVLDDINGHVDDAVDHPQKLCFFTKSLRQELPIFPNFWETQHCIHVAATSFLQS